MTQDELVEKYVALRDKKAALVAAHKAEVAKMDTVLDKVEAVLLLQFQKQGVESVRTPSGTAFKNVKTSVTVADWDAALGFVQANGAWHMLDKKLNKTAVLAYKDEHNDIPPGLNYREEVTVQVRRAS